MTYTVLRYLQKQPNLGPQKDSSNLLESKTNYTRNFLSNGNNQLNAKNKYYRNKLNKLKITLKKKYYERRLDITKGKRKQTWQIDVVNGKNKEKVHFTEFKKDNEPVTDRKEIVNRFNEYFVNVGPNLSKKAPANTNFSFKNYLNGNFMDSLLLGVFTWGH